MNPDPFEQHLQRRALPPLPPEWRAEILGAAAEAREEQERTETPGRGVSWKHIRWGALAAVWVGIVTFNQLEPTEIPQSGRLLSREEVMQSIQERERLFAEFSKDQPDLPARRPPVVPHRRGEGFHSGSLMSSTTITV